VSAFAGTVQTPWVFADQILSVSSDALALTSGGPIERAYVAHDVPSVDCEMLAVILGPLTMRTIQNTELSAGKAHINGWLNILTYRVLVMRDCVPVVAENGEEGAPPTPVEQSAVLRECAEDVWAIWHALVEAMAAGGFLAGKCMELFMDGAVPQPVSGMTAGWLITLRATVPGFVPGLVS
jgi:hypothetical protein